MDESPEGIFIRHILLQYFVLPSIAGIINRGPHG